MKAPYVGEEVTAEGPAPALGGGDRVQTGGSDSWIIRGASR